MRLYYDVDDAWKSLAERGKIKNVFDNGIEVGIILDSAGTRYYAKDKDGNPIERRIRERFIDRTDFVLQYNEFRSLKPGSEKERANGKQPEISPDVRDCRFGCADETKPLSLLKREPIVQLLMKDKRWSLYYNALPLDEEGSFLWVQSRRDGIKDALPHIVQKLDYETVSDMWNVFTNSHNSILFFNSLHAGASVNHLHLQQMKYKGYITTQRGAQPLKKGRCAIGNAKTKNVNGVNFLDSYPISGIVFGTEINPDVFWPYIERLQSGSIPFNWIMAGTRNIVIPRRAEHEKVEEFQNILASTELLGRFYALNERDYEEIDMKRVRSAFSKLSFSLDEILEMIK